jgi:prevent-host-death family protein
MNTVSATEARKHLPELLNRAGYGKERICIESHGKPVAVLISYEDLERLEALEDARDSVELRQAMAESQGLASVDELLVTRPIEE